MRRVVSYGGASGVPASQRLKLKLSMTAGMHLLYNDLKKEPQGFLAPVVEPEQERIIHRTSWATRNFSSTKSVIKGFVNRRSDSFTEGSVIEDAVKEEKRSSGGVPGLPVGIKTKDDREELIDRSAGRDLVLDDIRQKDVEGNPASNSEGLPGSSSDVGKGASVTRSWTDSTIKPACANPNPAADGGDGAVNTTPACSQSGASRSNIVNCNKESEQRVLGSEETHAPEPSVSSSDQVQEVQEECQPETLTRSEVVADRKHLQDLELELRVCALASASTTSSIVLGVGEDRRALRRVTDGADIDEQVQAKDNDDIKVVENPSIPSGDSRLNVIQGDLSFERNKGEDVSALRIQSCWKGWLRRGQYRLLKEVSATTRRNQELKNQEMCSAAVVLQKSWRGAQSRLVLKHLKIEKIVRDRAATVIQAHIRGHSCRCEFKKVSCAVLTIQNCWRRYRSSQQALAAAAEVAASIQQAEERRLHAAVTLQAYARGYVVRQELVRMHKAATTIQWQWKAHRVHMCMRAAIKLQAYARAFSVRRKYAMQKKAMVEERAAVLIQALVRGHLARCHLSILHMAALIIQLQWRRYSRNCRFEAAATERLVAHGTDSKKEIPADRYGDSLVQSGCVPVMVENDVEMEFFSEIDLSNGDDQVGFSKKDASELCPDLSSLEKMVDITVVQHINPCGNAGGKGYDLAVSSRRDDSGLRPLLNGELPAIPTGELPVGKASENEDWNDVSVDHLDECLDTCLASLKPLPADLSASGIAAEQCFPKFVILEEAHPAQQTSNSDRWTGCLSVDGTEAVKVAIPAKAQQASTTSQSAPRLQRASSRKGVKHEISKDVSSISSNGHLNQPTLSCRDSLQPAHSSSAKLEKDSQSKIENHQVAEIDYGSKGQGKSRHTENLKRNEERLQQFAQVFLLQRHIAHQQQRAQSAPPFPPPALAGSGSSQELQVGQTMEVCTESGTPERDSDSVAVRNVHDDADRSQAVSRHTKHNLDRGNVYCSDSSSTLRQPLLTHQSSGASCFKQHRQSPGTDVVVDMVLLLRKIEEVYGTSDVDFAESSSACFPTRSGDIEEGGPVVDRRKTSSTRGFTKSISMRQIGLPNVNAMLLVIIAMVVYTRTICRGVIFGHRQTHRKI